ncbi:MAG: threonine synthase [Gammaproteobacteria bacterium]|nr:threonine synthase [Gammaproteobacteria bacterium]
MSFVKQLSCVGCGRHFEAAALMNLCPDDQRPLAMELDIPALKAAYPRNEWYERERRDMWKFTSLLGLDINDAEDARHLVSLGEGATPLRNYPEHPQAKLLELDLYFKDEGRAEPGYGANPTQSFKDRGMAMAVSMARRHGLTKLVVPTQGNAGDSLAEYALAAGIEAAIIMPGDTPMPILGRVAALARQHESIILETCEGTIREAGDIMRSKYLPAGYFNVATFQEPGWRIEGKKTLGLEIAEPRSGDTWQLPDVIVYPTGGGTGILGMWKAFAELEALELIGSQRPRIVSVQSEGTAPIVRAFENGDDDTAAATAGHTLATGLNVPGGVGHAKVLQILRESRGHALTVSERAMEEELARCWKQTGWWISPEGAATLAALAPLAEIGFLRGGERVVVVNTGSFEKYLPSLRHLL